MRLIPVFSVIFLGNEKRSLRRGNRWVYKKGVGDDTVNPADLASAYLAMTSTDRAQFAKLAGLMSRAHGGSRRTKNGIHGGTRELVYAREGYRCYWCSCDLRATGAHLDHVIRERPHGMPVYLMVVASCPGCNVGRPECEEEARKVASAIARVDMSFARSLKNSTQGKALYAAVKAASNMGRPFTAAKDSFPV